MASIKLPYWSMDFPGLPTEVFFAALDQTAMVAVTDTQGKILFVNEKFCTGTGYSYDALIGQNPRLLNSGYHPKVFFQEMWETLGKGEIWRGEMLNRRCDGSTYWLEMTVVPVCDPGGHPQYYVAVHHDVTERNHLADLHRSIVQTRSHSIVAMDARGVITLFNKGAEEMLGYTAQEVVGRCTPMQFLDPDEVAQYAVAAGGEQQKNIPSGFGALVAKIMATGVPDENDWTYVTKSGKRGVAHLSLSVLTDGTGEGIHGFLGIGLDVSMAHKIASQVPGTIFQLLLRHDGTACFPYASDGLSSLFRIKPREVRQNATRIFEVIHQDDLQRVVADMRESARSTAQMHLEFRVCFGNEIRWIMANAVPESLPDGATLWHGFMADITAQKNVEEQVRWTAFHDPLTGLHNRLYAQNEIMRMEYSRHYPIAVFNIDLDGLKNVNDSDGHEAGDECIAKAADVLRRTFRTEDLIARMGGDEFLVLVPRTSENGMTDIRIRLAQQLTLVNEEGGRPLSFSVGAVLANVVGDLERSIREADRLMYLDKMQRKAGR
jgi:diguanylate cyclase (GGDEF)-like protein/PAS domain S-box-containing protein